MIDHPNIKKYSFLIYTSFYEKKQDTIPGTAVVVVVEVVVVVIVVVSVVLVVDVVVVVTVVSVVVVMVAISIRFSSNILSIDQ
jgi:hypothetical protein